MKLNKDGLGATVQGVAELWTTHSVAISTASTPSTTAFVSDTIRICGTQDCFFSIGATPTAVLNSGHYLPTGAIEYVYTGGGATKKIACIGSASGTLYVSEIV